MAAMLSRLLKPSRRWLQFSLRTMLLSTLAVAVWLGWFVDRAQRQKRAVEAIEARRGFVIYRHELNADMPSDIWNLDDAARKKIAGAPGPEWLCGLIGDEYFTQVVKVDAPLGKPRIVLKDSLRDLPWLEDLRIGVQCREDYECLRGLKRLKELFIVDWSPTISLQCLVESQGLESIVLRAGAAENLEGLEELSNLRELSIVSKSISAEAMQHIAALPRLERLLISCNSISAAAMTPLAGLQSLERLTLDCEGLSDAAIAPLAQLANLKSLAIQESQLTDAGLAHLANLPRLECLSIDADRFTSEGLARLNKNLTYLELRLREPVSDADLTYFKRLPKLNDLAFYRRAAITDAGLAILKTMPRLKEIYFKSPDVTKAGIEDLKRALPCCQVDIEIFKP